MRCRHRDWLIRKADMEWSVECLDVVAPGQPVTHLHGSWIGYVEDTGYLRVELSMPWGPHEAGEELRISPLVQLYRPALREFIYRPRTSPIPLSEQHQDFLDRHPEWDTDCAVVPGPRRFQ